jgi:hypothetical protein
MAKRLRPLLFTTLLLVVFQASFAQYGFSNEVGFFAGAYNLRSDFGERQNFESTTNTGFGVGLVHYMNFSYRRAYSFQSFKNYFNEHFKVKSEISYSETNLKHFGTWVDETRTSENAERLRRHTGKAQNFNIGAQLEFFPYEIKGLENGVYNFAPFVSFGFQFTFFQPQVFTNYNGSTDISNLDNFYLPWQVDEDPFLSTEAGNTFSLVASVGSRYKLAPLSDLVLELRWQYYFNDFVDGLNHKLDSNQNNDWAIWLTLGYVIYWER